MLNFIRILMTTFLAGTFDVGSKNVFIRRRSTKNRINLVKRLSWFSIRSIYAPFERSSLLGFQVRKDICGHFDQQYINRLSSVNKRKDVDCVKLEALKSRVKMTNDQSEYSDYFNRSVLKEHKFYSEITPSYSLLPIDAFYEIKKQFSNIKVIFMMRDPIDRMISQYKMHCRLTGKELNFCDKYFFDFVNSKKVAERGDYKSTVQNLDKVFNENQVFYGFY